MSDLKLFVIQFRYLTELFQGSTRERLFFIEYKIKKENDEVKNKKNGSLLKSIKIILSMCKFVHRFLTA